MDRSAESRALLEGLEADGTFVVRGAPSVPRAQAELVQGDSSVVLVVPRGFGADVASGGTGRVQVLVDGSDPARAIGASAALEQYATVRGLRVAAERALALGLPPVGRVTLEPRLLYNPSLKSRRFMVPGTAASILLIITTIVTAMGLAREREIGTMEQLLVTPIRPLVLMVGKTVPYAVFGLIDEILILILGNVLFEVPLRGSLLVIFAGTVAYLFTTLGVGLLISTVSRTQQQALMGGFFFTLPAMLLSGFMTPIDAMPAWIRPLTYLDPMRWFVEIVRSVLLRGATLADVARPLGFLTLLGVAVIAAASLRFRRQLV
jgi:ABC-2 type transport system permease protein